MALHFLRVCREKYHQATILAISKSWVAPIFENHPSIDGIISFEKKDLTGFRATSNAGKSLKALDLDQFYLLSDSYRAAYLAKKSGIIRRIGYPGQGRSGLLTHVIPHPKQKMHRSLQYLNLLGKQPKDLNWDPQGITLLDREKQWAKNELDNIGLTQPIALFPFSVASSRSVPELKILEILEKTNEPILLFGGKGDRAKSEILVEASQKENIRSVTGHYGLRNSMAMISQCKGALAADSGLGHISANLGIPTVSLFGAGDPDQTRPIGQRTQVLIENVHCSPCLKNKCYNRDEPLLCLEAIHPKSPWDALSELSGNFNFEAV